MVAVPRWRSGASSLTERAPPPWTTRHPVRTAMLEGLPPNGASHVMRVDAPEQ